MQQTWTEEIEATPKQIWATLADIPGWLYWLAQDGPYPPITQLIQTGPDTWQATTADGQRGVWQITAKVDDKRLEWRLLQLERTPLQYQQYHTIEIEPLEEKLTAVHWLVEWQKSGVGIKELMIDWLINRDIEEVLRISLQNLRIKVKESLQE
jgi:hypothetical protein